MSNIYCMLVRKFANAKINLALDVLLAAHEGSLGHKEYGVIKVLRDYFDPKHMMNPGGTLGLDVPEDKKHFEREDIPR